MLSPVLIICAAIAALAIFIGNIYVLVYFQHPDDRNQAYFPKFVVLLGLFLAEMTVLMLPFDVAVSGYGLWHEQNMYLLWIILYMILAFVLVVIIPFSLFYYESYDPENGGAKTQCIEAIKLETCTIIVVILTLVLMFLFLGTAEVPVQLYSPVFENISTAAGDIILPTNNQNWCSTNRFWGCVSSSEIISLDVTFPVYTIALVSFIGWFFFVVFASVGFAALPLDMFSTFRFRPKRIRLDEYVKQKKIINERAAVLKKKGSKIEQEGRHKSKSSKNRKIMNGFKKAVYLLELDYEKLEEANKGGGNPLVYWGYLFLGIFSLAFSICWLVHIVIYMFVDPADANPFLNNLFTDLNSSFGMLGTAFYGLFSFYLIWATIKGNLKMGLRFAFFTIHPMKLGGTMMNSFLFNVALILLCSVPIVQFCATAFSLFTHGAAVEQIFSIQISNLKFMRYFFLNNVFLYAFFGLFGLTFIYLIICPSDTRKQKAKGDIRNDEDAWMAF